MISFKAPKPQADIIEIRMIEPEKFGFLRCGFSNSKDNKVVIPNPKA